MLFGHNPASIYLLGNNFTHDVEYTKNIEGIASDNAFGQHNTINS